MTATNPPHGICGNTSLLNYEGARREPYSALVLLPGSPDTEERVNNTILPPIMLG